MKGRLVTIVSVVAIVALGAASVLGAAAPGPPVQPARPVPRPPAPRRPGVPGAELPEGPDTPREKLPAQYFATLGETHVQYRQWAAAEEAFGEAYQREKDAARRAAYAFRLGQLHLRKKELDKALLLIEEAVKNLKGGAQSYEARRYRTTLAAAYERMGQHDKAEAVYQEWLKAAENRYEKDLARRQLLSFWKRTGKLDDAVARYEARVEEKPDDADTLATLRLIYTSVKPDPAKALAITEKLAVADPDDRDTALHLISAYERARQYDKAIALLEKLIDKEPRDAAFLASRLVHLYVQNKQQDKAVAYAKAMAEKDPKSPEAQSRVAGIYQRLNMVDEALAAYEAAAGLATSDAQRDRYLLSAAHAARSAKKYEKAEALAKRLANSGSKITAAQAKRLLFDLYEEQNKLDQIEIGPRKDDEKKK